MLDVSPSSSFYIVWRKKIRPPDRPSYSPTIPILYETATKAKENGGKWPYIKETWRLRFKSKGTIPTPPSGPADVWDGSIDTSWYDPRKTEFTITRASQLAGLAAIVNGDSAHSAWQDNFSGRTVTLTADIDLAGREWTPIGADFIANHIFQGTFDGGRHTISNLTIEVENVEYNRYYGFFGHNSGTIKNINLTGVNIDVSSSPSSPSSRVGSIVGYNLDGTLSDCDASGIVTASASSDYTTFSYAGGIVGVNFGTLSDCDANVDVSSFSFSSPAQAFTYAGGIAGYSSTGTLTDCDASGIVTASASYRVYTGGIVGYYDSGTVTYCDASGRVTGSITGSTYDSSREYVGGVIGYLCHFGTRYEITNNHFSSSTGQMFGIGLDERENPPGPSNDI